MIESFQARNFRCFKELDLSDLGRVNVVVGNNAAGKTAVLEVLSLGLRGTPQALFSLNQLRSYAFYMPQMNREQFEAQFNSYFFGLDPSGEIGTEWADTTGQKASLRIHYSPEKAVTPVLGPQFTGQPVPTIIPLAFERTDMAGKPSTLHASVAAQGGGLLLEQGPDLGVVSEFFPSTWVYNPQQSAQYYSQLSQKNREEEIIAAVRREFDPLIEDLTILAPYGIPSLYATLPFLPEKLPLSLVSVGINKFFSIIAAIPTHPHGVVLIDEIENGLHYGRFASLWSTVLSLAKHYDVQVFASTHSLECLRAMIPAIEKDEGEFRLLHAERENGFSIIRTINGSLIEAALEQSFELR